MLTDNELETHHLSHHRYATYSVFMLYLGLHNPVPHRAYRMVYLIPFRPFGLISRDIHPCIGSSLPLYIATSFSKRVQNSWFFLLKRKNRIRKRTAIQAVAVIRHVAVYIACNRHINIIFTENRHKTALKINRIIFFDSLNFRRHCRFSVKPIVIRRHRNWFFSRYEKRTQFLPSLTMLTFAFIDFLKFLIMRSDAHLYF